MTNQQKITLLEELNKVERMAGQFIVFMDGEGSGLYQCGSHGFEDLFPRPMSMEEIEPILDQHYMSAITVTVRQKKPEEN